MHEKLFWNHMVNFKLVPSVNALGFKKNKINIDKGMAAFYTLV